MIPESVLYVINSQQPFVCSPQTRLCNPTVIIVDNFYPQPLVTEPGNTPESSMPIVEIRKPDIPQNTFEKPARLAVILENLLYQARNR